jgi:hypothetical protein
MRYAFVQHKYIESDERGEMKGFWSGVLVKRAGVISLSVFL